MQSWKTAWGSDLNLTLQIYNDGLWQDVMTMAFSEPAKGFFSPCRFGYEPGYVHANLNAFQTAYNQAVSARLPVDFDSVQLREAPAFLHDIAPSGAAKRFLLKHLGRQKPEGVSDDLYLLSRSTPAPVGNLRIKESLDALDMSDPVGFSRQDVVVRDQRFLEYAYEQGAAIGGATGAGGEAPKLLMTQAVDGLLHPDAVLPDEHASAHWFIKFSRGAGLQSDQTILRSEYLYYKALDALNIPTVATADMALEEGSRPSLWLRRFDRQVAPEGVQRHAIESMYSLAGVTVPGSRMDHVEVVQMLAQFWTEAGQQAEVSELVLEYMRRDLLNRILGNSDNHGRNTAIIRKGDGFKLAPIYDLAPMVTDAEGITRTTKWPKEIERAGEMKWRDACSALANLVNPDDLFERLRAEASRLRALPDLLHDSGLPSATFDHPAIALGRLDQRLAGWSLL